ncbi:MAG TPA: GAF domain-containing protein [Anaerolineae bacterium]|nr:GAF domain-containing protein [Anaerolineae bacterium]
MKFWDFLWLLMGQFAGGPGPKENNLMRFGIPAVIWTVLLWVAWSRQRHEDLPREKLLAWGFGLGFAREAFMFLHTASKILTRTETDACIVEPVEHALAMAALVVVGAAFLRYILDDRTLARRYIRVGLAATALCYLVTFLWWPQYNALRPEIKFHLTWFSWVFHITSSLLIAWAIYELHKGRGWLRNVVSVAMALFFLGEALALVNYSTGKVYDAAICRIANTCHILAIPILGYVYFREQTLEKEAADAQVRAYRDHLEELVAARTTALSQTNIQLQQEIAERQLAQTAVAQLSHRNELILGSAGEGIFGIDQEGKHIFVNPAAAEMLGYTVDELIGRPSHSTWHHSYPDGTPYPETECPIHAGYRAGSRRRGDDEVFWRKDGSRFPARYVSTPFYQDGKLAGAVVVFQDITERKTFEEEITRSNMELAAQNTIAATLSQSLHLDATLNTALDAVLSILGIEIGGIFLLDPVSNSLTLCAYRSGASPETRLPFMPPLHLDECLSGQCIMEMRPMIFQITDLPNKQKNFDIAAFIGENNPQVLVCAPLISRGKAIGALLLAAQHHAAIPLDRLELLGAIGQQIGMAVENARLYQETEDLAEQLTMLHQASIALSGPFTLAQLYDQIASLAAKLLDCQIACLYTWDDDAQLAENVATYVAETLEQEELDIPLSGLPCLQELVTHRRSVAIENGRTDPRVPLEWRRAFGVHGLLCLPLWTKSKPLGVLFVIDQRTPRRWRPDEIILGQSFANRASMTLENAYLNQEIEKTATMHERRRIAAELHDGVGQTLSYMGLQVDQVAQIKGDDREALREVELEKIRGAVNQATRELRAAIDHLLSKQQPRKALRDLLSDITQTFNEEHQTHVRLIGDHGAALFLSPDQNEQVTRIVQEGLSNAVRHAHAHNISVALGKQADTIIITVSDDGLGFDPEEAARSTGHHFGLSIMQARANRIGGQVTVDSAPGKGTRITLSFQGG